MILTGWCSKDRNKLNPNKVIQCGKGRDMEMSEGGIIAGLLELLDLDSIESSGGDTDTGHRNFDDFTVDYLVFALRMALRGCMLDGQVRRVTGCGQGSRTNLRWVPPIPGGEGGE
jgi:hypothetical protein